MSSVQADQFLAHIVSVVGAHLSLHANEVVVGFVVELKACLAFCHLLYNFF